MNINLFTDIRHFLNLSQSELAAILCISTKAVQSYEQGWRNIPFNIARNMLFFLYLKIRDSLPGRPCWEIKKCPLENQKKCIVKFFNAGELCWFISGTYCKGKKALNWETKMAICKECEIWQNINEKIKRITQKKDNQSILG